MWSNENGYDDQIAEASANWSVPVSLIKAVIGTESAFNPQAYNASDPGGAWGLMQMIPSTAIGLGYTGDMADLLSDTRTAIDLGTRLLAQNLARANGNVADAVSAYNGGFRPTMGFGAVRPDGTYANQAYVDRVLAAQVYFDGSQAGAIDPETLGLLMAGLALWFLWGAR